MDISRNATLPARWSGKHRARAFKANAFCVLIKMIGFKRYKKKGLLKHVPMLHVRRAAASLQEYTKKTLSPIDLCSSGRREETEITLCGDD